MSQSRHPEAVRAVLTLLLQSLPASRAAGFWSADDRRLVQQAFLAGPTLSDETANGFASATREVPLDRTDLSIARAALEGFAVAHVDDPSFAAGSGQWLRAFGALRSVAVALRTEDELLGVMSVAVADDPRSDGELAAVVHSAARHLLID